MFKSKKCVLLVSSSVSHDREQQELRSLMNDCHSEFEGDVGTQMMSMSSIIRLKNRMLFLYLGKRIVLSKYPKNRVE